MKKTQSFYWIGRVVNRIFSICSRSQSQANQLSTAMYISNLSDTPCQPEKHSFGKNFWFSDPHIGTLVKLSWRFARASFSWVLPELTMAMKCRQVLRLAKERWGGVGSLHKRPLLYRCTWRVLVASTRIVDKIRSTGREATNHPFLSLVFAHAFSRYGFPVFCEGISWSFFVFHPLNIWDCPTV